MATEWTPPELGEALPDIAEEIIVELRSMGEGDLAAQVPQLSMLSLCGCNDSFCACFSTGDLGPGGTVDTVVLEASNLDVVEGRIVYVEIITRDYSELRDRVRAVFGNPPEAWMRRRT